MNFDNAAFAGQQILNLPINNYRSTYAQRQKDALWTIPTTTFLYSVLYSNLDIRIRIQNRIQYARGMVI